MIEVRSAISEKAEYSIDSRYLLAPVMGAGWLAGIWLGSALEQRAGFWLALAVAAFLLTAVWWRQGRMGLALAGLGALALGAARYTVAQPPLDPGHLHYYNGAKDVVVLGEVAAEPELGDTQARLRVGVGELIIDGVAAPVRGTLLVQTARYPAIPYGAAVRLSGDIDAVDSLNSPGYAAYLERQGVRSIMQFARVETTGEIGGSPLLRLLFGIKDAGRRAIQTSLPEPHAALLTGILLGDDSGMPHDLTEEFRTTGMTHIIAISGFNIAILIALLDQLTAPLFSRRRAALVVMLVIVLYTLLVGASASVIRAAIMGIAYLISLRFIGRPSLAVAGLFTAAFLMTFLQPGALWDVGFQLSFAATLGLLLYAGPWTRRFERGSEAVFAPEVGGRVTKLLGEALIVTLAAQVLTLPLILYHFGRLSLVSLPANLLVLPVQPGVMAAGGLTLLAGLILPRAGQIIGMSAWLFLNYTITAIRLLAAIPGASVPLPLSVPGLAGVYVAIAAVTLLATGQKAARPASNRLRLGRRSLVVALAGIAIIGLLVLAWFNDRPDGRLHIAFLDVGQGDAIFIQTPTGRQVLIDGGRYPSVVLDELGRQMPFWDHSIDLVVATHPDADHVAGLVSVLERYRVSRLITNGADAASDSEFGAMLAAAETGDTPAQSAREGELIRLDEGVKLEVLHAGAAGMGDNRNDASIVARLTYGDLSVLLTGDAEAAAEEALLRSGQPLDSVILKAGHHGADTSSGVPFLRAVSPQIVVISAGRDNSYGHPSPAMLARVEAMGAMILRTDESGTVEVASDGRQMWWTVENENVAVP